MVTKKSKLILKFHKTGENSEILKIQTETFKSHNVYGVNDSPLFDRFEFCFNIQHQKSYGITYTNVFYEWRLSP